MPALEHMDVLKIDAGAGRRIADVHGRQALANRQSKRSLSVAAGQQADGRGLWRVQTVQTIQGAQQRCFAGTEHRTELLFHAQHFGFGGGQ
ncbi:hypothetical protein XBLMG947_3836 [Xanthomonas bromi]|uniref:Uncharacterized protein n=1 Tax=Xanthomonas bromi TaxID=56449 RepID=A0A1C3NRL6_9XANT|nr:hypothetical protein XBLMG947_3836 [Xanthomonas bromi]